VNSPRMSESGVIAVRTMTRMGPMTKADKRVSVIARATLKPPSEAPGG
jgi:hypothetical protein